MCGICGYRSKANPDLPAMLRAISHRGPDGSGEFFYSDVGLGHCRLAIIDIAGGAQPMVHNESKCVIIFNGEIYNFKELRTTLEKDGFNFFSLSDTEVLLAMYLKHGTKMLDFLNGMFAFVIYDPNNDILFGARDRLGLKPLYYTINYQGFFFASEIKSLLSSGLFSSVMDPTAIVLYLTKRFIPGRRTAYKNIFNVRPGEYFIVKSPCDVTLHRYWDLPDQLEQPSDKKVQDHFAEYFTSSIQYRLISDVPLGLFLSGGVDSTAIVAGMFEAGHKPIRTFTLGFSDQDLDVMESARTSAHFDCLQTVEKVRLEDFDLFPKLLYHMDGPYGDPILLPLYLLCRSAAKSVKVVLSGDGADETQLGYIHHEALAKLLRITSFIPSYVLKAIGASLRFFPIGLLDNFFNYPSSMGQEGKDRLQTLLANAGNPGIAYQTFANLFSPRELKELCGPELRQGLDEAQQTFFREEIEEINRAKDPLGAIYRYDLRHWLPDNILTKYDKMTMATSIEGRAPFLDYRLVAFLASLPSRSFIRKGIGKKILREYIDRQVRIPGREISRKRAFYFPLTGGFQARLESLVHDCLEGGLLPEEMICGQTVRRLLREAGSLLGSKRLFTLAALGMWLKSLN